jgi:PIN domain nuclease of toxin-antitoxin system
MADAVTDTHALIWYLENDPRLGTMANEAFAACDRGEIAIYVPTICIVEITYLQEKGRIPIDLKIRFDTALQTEKSGLRIADLTLEVAIALARVARTEVPDLPDRIIAATALHLAMPLISKDRKIKHSSIVTIW